MASHPPTTCCIVGVKHEGTPTGELKTIAGTETYVAYPADKSTDKAVLFLTDVLGHSFVNAQLMADQFAANGYFTVMPDLFHGDPIPLNRAGGTFDINKWRESHGIETVDPIVEAALKEMRGSLGCKRIGAVGYCYGAKPLTRYLKPGQIDAGYVAHPSWVSSEEVKGIEGPLSIAAAETDGSFTTEKRRETEEILANVGKPWQINLYSGVQHGFAVRGDLTKPELKFAKEQAFIQAVTWFDVHVKST